MAIMRWRPMWDLPDINRLFDEDSMVPQTMRSFTPAVDIYQDQDNVIAEAPLPGIDPEKVNVSVENDVLKIEGSAEHKTEVDEQNYYRKEVRYGSFYRAVALPTRVKADQAEASYENGILKVMIPKAEEVKPKSIKVSVSKKGNHSGKK